MYIFINETQVQYTSYINKFYLWTVA